MAEEKVIIRVEFDTAAAEKRSIELTQQLTLAKTAQAALNAEFKEGKLTAEAHAKAYTQSQKAIKDLTTEQGNLNRTISLAERVNKVNTGSLNEMSARYSLLVQAIRGLSEEEREHSDLGKTLVAQAKELNDKLREQEKQYGSNKRGIGDYIKEINIFGVSVGEASESLKDGFEGIQTFTKGVSLSKGALVALTAVPIILFLVGLVAFFKATDAGADKLEQGINALKVGFTVFTKGLVLFKDYGE
ncbi:MAG: hypothetical protein V4714_21370, partial [Bacteroidota bacterium]